MELFGTIVIIALLAILGVLGLIVVGVTIADILKGNMKLW